MEDLVRWERELWGISENSKSQVSRMKWDWDWDWLLGISERWWQIQKRGYLDIKRQLQYVPILSLSSWYDHPSTQVLFWTPPASQFRGFSWPLGITKSSRFFTQHQRNLFSSRYVSSPPSPPYQSTLIIRYPFFSIILTPHMTRLLLPFYNHLKSFGLG
jgi:hypothetical protein